MTVTSDPFLLKALAVEVLVKTEIYKVDKSHEKLDSLMTSLSPLVTSVRKYVCKYYKDHYAQFDHDITLEYIYTAISKRTVSDPINTIRHIAYRYVDRFSRLRADGVVEDDMVDTYEPKAYINDRLLISDIIKQECQDLDQQSKSLVYFYLMNYHLIRRFTNFYRDKSTMYIVTLKVYQIRRRIMKNKGTNRELDIITNKDRVSNLLMLSGLFNHHPSMFVLLALFKDPNQLTQFLTLFGGSEIKVPTIEDVNRVLRHSGEVATNFSKGSMTVKSREALASLVTNLPIKEINSQTEINLLLSEFIKSFIESSLKNYDMLHEKYIKSIDMKDADAVAKAYKIISTEMNQTIKLCNEIVSTLNTVSEMSDTVDHLSRNPSDSATAE